MLPLTIRRTNAFASNPMSRILMPSLLIVLVGLASCGQGPKPPDPRIEIVYDLQHAQVDELEPLFDELMCPAGGMPPRAPSAHARFDRSRNQVVVEGPRRIVEYLLETLDRVDRPSEPLR